MTTTMVVVIPNHVVGTVEVKALSPDVTVVVRNASVGLLTTTRLVGVPLMLVVVVVVASTLPDVTVVVLSGGPLSVLELFRC